MIVNSLNKVKNRSGAQIAVWRPGLLAIFTLCILCVASPAHGQFWKDWFKKKKPEEGGVLGGKDKLDERIKSRTLDDGEDARPLIFVDSAASDKRVVRKKKIPKRMFYGVMTKKAFIKKIVGRKVVVEQFYFLKKKQDIQPYVKEIYWYHQQKKKIFVGAINKKDEPYAKILHGPYKKLNDGKVEEEGIFYFGAKHGRWMYEKLQGEEMVLTEKEKYYKGFPKESNFSYFDVDKTKIKEVVPLVNGEKHGDYVLFSEAGNLIADGNYENGVKVGKWTNYFDNNKRKVRRQIQYQKTWDTKDFQPFTLIEYDDKGKVTYDRAAEEKKKPTEQKPDPTKEF